jgi:capsid portal protein
LSTDIQHIQAAGGLTRADRSNATATGGGTTKESLSTVDIGSPSQIVTEAAGDKLVLLAAGQTYVVEPVEEPNDAYAVYKLSPHLSPILSAISTNVYSAQVAFEPYIDLSKEESTQVIEDALGYEKAMAAGQFDATVKVGRQEVETAAKKLRRRQRNEQQFLEAWIGRCCPGGTYRTLRILVGLDMEVMGSGYMEVLRNTNGRPHNLLWAPAWCVRARPVQPTLVPCQVPVQVSKLSWALEWQLRRFRSYVQLDMQNKVVGLYKEYGDPRVLSRKTGKYYASLDEMLANTDDEWYETDDHEPVPAQPATELLSFQLQTPVNTTYGKPDWTGVYPALAGARELEEMNREVITDQAVPQMFVLASGGAGISQAVIDELKEKIKENRQQGNRSIYFIQAQSAKLANGGLSPNPDLEIVKTKSEQHTDALGTNYSKGTAKLARTAYRMPRAELGDDEGTSKDQQLWAHRFAESQVYDPRRDIIDDRSNTTFVRDLGIQSVRQRHRPRPPKEPRERAEVVSLLTRAGILTPDDGRIEARDILDREFPELLGVWSKLPKELLTAILQTKNQLVAAALLDSNEKGDFLNKLREALEGQLGSTEPTRPGQVPVPKGGELLQAGKDKQEPEPEPEK